MTRMESLWVRPDRADLLIVRLYDEDSIGVKSDLKLVEDISYPKQIISHSHSRVSYQ